MTITPVTGITSTANTSSGPGGNAGTLTGTTLASNVVSSSLTSVGTLTSLSTSGAINSSIAQTTLNGTTAGNIVWSQPFQGTSFKKFVCHAGAYENNSAVNQTITFSTAFTNTPAITFNNTGLTISVSTTTLTITAPNNTTTFTGMIIVEGF